MRLEPPIKIIKICHSDTADAHGRIPVDESFRPSSFMVALCNRETIYIFILFLLSSSSSFFFSSPNLSSRRLDVYHTSAHGVVLV